jgi:hypothetical protein
MTDAARVAQSALQAVMFSEILKPLTKDLGPAGDITVEAVTQKLFAPVPA